MKCVGSPPRAEEHRFRTHARQIEASMVLALNPEQVDMAQAQNFASVSQARPRNSTFWVTEMRKARLTKSELQPDRRGKQCSYRQG